MTHDLVSLNLTLSQLTTDTHHTIAGRSFEYLAQIPSTHTLLIERARAGAPEGHLILAEEQTAGRGRLGRRWLAPAGQNLLFSLLLRPTWLPVNQAFSLTMLASVALCEAIERTIAVPTAIKWPNDVMLSGTDTQGRKRFRKTAGILSELEIRSGELQWAVLGMGINVNWAPTGIIDGVDLSESASSLAQATGAPVDRRPLLLALCTALDQQYRALQNDGRDALWKSWRERLSSIGQEVTVRTPSGLLAGIAEDVDHSGALLLRSHNGQCHTVLTGDVSA